MSRYVHVTALGAYLIPDSPVFIGADGRVLLPLEGGDRAVAIPGTAGVNF